jgi:hypothetical protein
MRKVPTDSNVAAYPGRSGSRLSKIAVIVLIGAISTPLVIEFVGLYHSKWSAIMGKSRNARTPMLDIIRDTLLKTHEDLSLVVSHSYWRFFDRPNFVLSVAAITITIGMFFLRKSVHIDS